MAHEICFQADLQNSVRNQVNFRARKVRSELVPEIFLHSRSDLRKHGKSCSKNSSSLLFDEDYLD